ncbi:hypothetical protein, partial [Sphingobacterium haloxyli]|uniref:hypothetical protein n=1 Tax=Sphingobacterium haloxyli TaxID=2100533 RepID=UPI001A9D45CD
QNMPSGLPKTITESEKQKTFDKNIGKPPKMKKPPQLFLRRPLSYFYVFLRHECGITEKV